MRQVLARVRGPALAALLLVPPLYAAAQGDAIAPAVAAIKANDCAALGAAANRGIKESVPALLYVAGLMFEEGLCVEADRERANRFYRAAEAPGDWNAARDLGLRFALGDGLPRSFTRAYAWLDHARALRDAPGQPAPLRLPRTAAGTEEDEWRGYLYAVWWVGNSLTQFPPDVQVEGVDAETSVRVCPLKMQVEVKFDGVPGGQAAGALRPRRAAVQSELERAYSRALTVLPMPVIQGEPEMKCVENVVRLQKK